MEKDFLYKDVNARSEEVQEIMGRVPHWILRRGIAIIFLIFILLLTGSYFFRYPEKVSVKVHILSAVPPMQITFKADGHLKRVLVHNGDTVRKGQTLAFVEYIHEGRLLEDSIASPMDGILNLTHTCENGVPVTPDTPFFVITSTYNRSLEAYGMLSPDESAKVRRSMRVIIRSGSSSADELIEGSVRTVSAVPDAEGNYFFDILLTRFVSATSDQGPETIATAEIIVKEKSILESLLQPIASLL